jgi:5-methylcytosine-specific restriction endonuclease McrA
MKFELNRPTDYSDEAFINEIIKVSKLIDKKPLTVSKFEKNSRYSVSTIERRFGSWIKALEKSGLDKSYWHLQNRKISTEEIVKELNLVSEILKTKSFTRNEFEVNSSMSRFVFKGSNSFNKIMKLAGLEIPKKSRKYTDLECYENLLIVWTYYGRQPKYSEMKISPSMVGPKAYVLRWGGWIKALLAFIEKVNTDLTEDVRESESLQIPMKIKDQQIKTNKEERREIPLGLRYDILRRDKFCCVICGAMPKTHNISLEVDHIIPWTKGGKTIHENLRTLCNCCNKGKSNKTE